MAKQLRLPRKPHSDAGMGTFYRMQHKLIAVVKNGDTTATRSSVGLRPTPATPHNCMART